MAPIQAPTSRRKRLKINALAAMLASLLGALFLLAACGGDDDAGASDPAAVLAEHEDARNAKDVDALVALYAEDAAITDHPLDDDGTADVGELHVLETEAAGVSRSTHYLNVEVDGNTVTFDQEFTPVSGGCSVTAGDQATIEDGKIIVYTWVPRPQRGQRACE